MASKRQFTGSDNILKTVREGRERRATIL